MVRLGAVRELTRARDEDCHVVLSSGVRVPVARRRRRAMREALHGTGRGK
jgi:DNA-binding LytR/AlgR family response regulator